MQDEDRAHIHATRLRYAAATLLLAGSALGGWGGNVAAQDGVQWARWGEAAGAQHARELARRGLQTNELNCGSRAALELTSRARAVEHAQRAEFMDAFDRSCVGGGFAAHEPALRLGGPGAPEPKR